MVHIVKKQVSGKLHYYLSASYRDDGKHYKKEKYIGTKLPKKDKLDSLKEQFELQHNLELCKKYKIIVLRKNELETIEKVKLHYHSNLRKIPKSILEDYYKPFVINFTYNTHAIEDSKLSFHETRALLNDGVPANKPFDDQIEAKNHKRVFNELLRTKQDLSLRLIYRWHKLLFKDTKNEVAGKLRNWNVAVAHFKAPHYVDIPKLLNQFIEWYKKNKRKYHPVEFAALTHLKFVKIHPFGDGNGRIARLLMNFVLLKKHYPLLSVQYDDRLNYYKALDKYDETQEEEVFLKYIVKVYLKEIVT